MGLTKQISQFYLNGHDERLHIGMFRISGSTLSPLMEVYGKEQFPNMLNP